ncbi:ABC transporter ATP-binding protein [Pusillimonas sp. CC-YST705]|uniref:ABC transporter ATP-binding protein n=1 Tax=Mesopusillimonas faecipullorum TaxID=2755040 RepID=A0ABS8CB58_9BURK|nr:ABC transporter ATP-binding protein [Mesopusillimonas faecipullorum]MCB5363271.1 ABC transporter ATP-binding protein [Mesopusillimonas faecipullorum]
MLEISNLHSGYGSMTILHGVSLNVAPGEVVCLLGANGAGKSTLLRTISGLLPMKSGRIHFNGQSLEKHSTEKIVRMGLAHVPEGREIFGGLTVDQNLRLGAYSGRLNSSQIRQAREQAFAYFPVVERKLQSKASALSGGEQQMVAMARALMSGPSMLLLDEPSLGLAPKMIQTVLDVVASLKQLGVPILLVEQNATAALAVADRGYVIEHGRVVADASAAQLLADDTVRRNYLGL